MKAAMTRRPKFDISTATPEEIIAEAERRRSARDAGRSLDVGSVLRASSAEMDQDPLKREREIQEEVVRQYRAFGCVVFSTSQVRRAKVTPGIPDLFVFNCRVGRSWWHETKTAAGVHSPDQMEFAAFCQKCNEGYVTGGVGAAEEALVTFGVARRIGDFLQSTLHDQARTA